MAFTASVPCVAVSMGLFLGLDLPPSKYFVSRRIVSCRQAHCLFQWNTTSNSFSNEQRLIFILFVAIRSNYSWPCQEYKQIPGKTYHLAQRSWICNYEGPKQFPGSILSTDYIVWILWYIGKVGTYPRTDERNHWPCTFRCILLLDRRRNK